MKILYKNRTALHPMLQWAAAAVCAAAYFLCCLPSFHLIGRFTVQMTLSVVLSAICTVLFFFILPRSLTVIGKGLSLFLMTMLTIAIKDQIVEQIKAGSFTGWVQTFFYDRPLTVAIVWAVAFVLVMAMRLLLPYNEVLRPFRADYLCFFKDSSGVFLLFYVCVLIYCFLLQRKPGGESGINLVPFSMISAYIASASFAYESIFYLIGNVLCFFPFGFFYRVYKPRFDVARFIMLPIILSLLIEISQIVFGMGDFDVDDIIMNAFGFYFGYFLSYLADKIREKRTAGEETTIFAPADA